MNDVGDILTTLAGKWEELNDTERNALATSIAGTRQRENFIALMENYGDAVDYTENALNSAGTAEEKFGDYTEGIEAKIQTMKAMLEELATKVLNSSLIKDVIDGFSSGIQFLTNNLDHFARILQAIVAIGAVKLFTLMGQSVGGFLTKMALFPSATLNASTAVETLTNGLVKNKIADDIAADGATQYAAALSMLGMSTTGVTAKEAIRQMQTLGVWEVIKGKNDEEQRSILLAMGYNKEIVEQIIAQGKLSIANLFTAETWKRLGNSIKMAFISNPLGMILGIITAIETLGMFIDDTEDKLGDLTQEIESITQSVSESKNKLMEAKRAASEATNALEENLEAIEKLESKDSLTYVEDIELQKLKEVTAELERQVELTKEEEVSNAVIYYSKIGEAADELKYKLEDLAYTEQVTDYQHLKELYEEALTNDNPFDDGYALLFKDDLDEAKSKIDEIQSAIDEIIETTPAALLKIDRSILDNLFPDETELKATINKALIQAEKMYKEMAEMTPEQAIEIFGSEEQWNAELEKTLQLMYKNYGILGDASRKEFAAAFAVTGFPQFEEVTKELQTLAEQGKLTQDALSDISGWEEYATALQDIGLYDVAIILRIFNERFQKSEEIIEKVKPTLEELKDELDSIKDAYDTLSSAIEEYNSNGSISYDTWKELIELEDKYLSVLVDEEGQIKSNEQALQDLMKAKIEEATLTRIETYVANLETAAKNGTLKEVLDLTEGIEDETNARLRNVLSIVACMDATKEEKQQILDTISAMIKMSSTISLVGDSTDSTKDKIEEYEEILEAAETIVDSYIDKKEELIDTAEKHIETIDKEIDKIDKLIEAEEKQIDSIDDKISAKEKEKRKDEDAIDIIDDKISAKEKEKRADEDAIDVIDGKIDVKEKEKRTDEDAIEVIDNKIDKIQNAIDAKQEEIDTINKEIEVIEERNEKLNEEIEFYDDIISASKNYVNEKISALEEEKKLLQDKNEEKEKEIELEELQRNLQKAQQKTMRVFSAEKGTWEWVVDEAAVKEAERDIEEYENQEKIDNIDKEINSWEKYLESLEEIPNAFENARLDNILENNKFISKKDIDNKNKKSVENLKNTYLNTQNIISQNEAEIESKNDLIDQINKIIDKREDEIKVLEDSKKPHQNRINRINNEINKLEKSKRPHQDRIDKIDDEIDVLEKSKRPHQDNIDRINDEIEALEKSKTPIQDRINKYEKQKEKWEEQKQPYEDYIEQLETEIDKLKDIKTGYENLTKTYETERAKQLLEMQGGRTDEADVLDGKLLDIENFKEKYKKALESTVDTTQQAQEAINTIFGGIDIIKMFTEVQSFANFIKAFAKSAVSKNEKNPFKTFLDNLVKNAVDSKNSSKNSKNSSNNKKNTNKIKIRSYEFEAQTGNSGEVFVKLDNGSWALAEDVRRLVNTDMNVFTMEQIKSGNYSRLLTYAKPYASGTKSSASGLATVDEKGNELIVPKQGRYRMMEYGDTVVPHNLSQRIFEVASNPLRFVANALNSVKTPNLMSNSNQVSNSSIIHIGTIELPSVTNGDNFIKQLQLIASNR